MSGRASRVVISVLLLSAALALPSLVTMPTARAAVVSPTVDSMAASASESCFGHSFNEQLTFTVGAGLNRLMVVVVTSTANYTNDPAVTVEWGRGKQALTEFSTTPGNPAIIAYYIFQPNSGADTIYVNATNQRLDGLVAASFTGVSQISPPAANPAPSQANGAGTGTSPSVVLTPADANDFLLSGVVTYNSGLVPSNTFTGAAQQVDMTIVRSGAACSVSSWGRVSLGVRTASGTADWTATAANLGWSEMAFDIRGINVVPPSGGGPGPTPTPLPNVVYYPKLLNCNVVAFNDPRGGAAVSSTILWVYDFGDGTSIVYSPVPAVTHNYTVSGVYDATMTVQDKQGNVHTFGMTVDTTPVGCAVSTIRMVGPYLFGGLFIAFIVASFVIPKKSKLGKYGKHFRRVAAGSAFVAVLLVLL